MANKKIGKPRLTEKIDYKRTDLSGVGFARRSNGFSLIELMIAMSLFAFSLLAIMSLQVKALGLLSDANLKSQAIILASSHQELQKLSSKEIEDLDLLLSNWQSLAHNKIPEVTIKKSSGSEKDFYIMLTWPSRQKKSNCDGGSQSSIDCFNL